MPDPELRYTVLPGRAAAAELEAQVRMQAQDEVGAALADAGVGDVHAAQELAHARQHDARRRG